MHLEALETEMSWLDAALGGDALGPVADAADGYVPADLLMISMLDETPRLSMNDWLPEVVDDVQPLPAQLSKRLNAIAADVDETPSLAGWFSALWSGLSRPWALGLAAAAALAIVVLPRVDDGVVKGPLDIAAAPATLVGLHLVRRADDSQIKRLPVEALELGGHGAKVKVGEPLLPVFQSPEVDLAATPYSVVVFLGDGDSAWQIAESGGAAPLASLPGTAHLYAAPEPIVFDAPGDVRLLIVMSPEPIAEDLIEEISSTLADTPLSDGRPSRLSQRIEGALEASLRVEVR